MRSERTFKPAVYLLLPGLYYMPATGCFYYNAFTHEITYFFFCNSENTQEICNFKKLSEEEGSENIAIG
jgi:hypothetical protein